jgi:hypothetical protein
MHSGFSPTVRLRLEYRDDASAVGEKRPCACLDDAYAPPPPLLRASCVKERPPASDSAHEQLVMLRGSHVQPDPPLDEVSVDERGRMVDFMVELADELGLRHSAALAVSYYDRFCAVGLHAAAWRHGEPRDDTEIVAKACVLVASKFYEQPANRLSALDGICHWLQVPHQRAALKEAELMVLGALDWRLHVATPDTFLELLRATLGVVDEPPGPGLRAEHWTHMSLFEGKTLVFTPVVVAAAAMLCAWHRRSDHEAERVHTERLAALCGAGIGELFRCKSILLAFQAADAMWDKPAPGAARAVSPDVVYATDFFPRRGAGSHVHMDVVHAVHTFSPVTAPPVDEESSTTPFSTFSPSCLLSPFALRLSSPDSSPELVLHLSLDD